jgi:predicted DNA-binding transcriptional regulator YafY
MFSDEEIEALVVGSRWVADRADHRLGLAARNALSKIAAVLPPELRHGLDTSALMVGPGEPIAAGDTDVGAIRQAIRAERKLAITYIDLKEVETHRTSWPFALAYFDRVRVVAAWCELRAGYRHFRTDRIVAFSVATDRYPRRRHTLLKEWREVEGIPEQ